MRICFNQTSTIGCSDLMTDLMLCERFGFDLIELRTPDKLRDYLAGHSVEELAEYFRTHAVKPFSIDLPTPFNQGGAAADGETAGALAAICETASAIGCVNIILVPELLKERKLLKEIETEAVRRLRMLAPIAADHGVRLALEFIGRPESSVSSFGQAWDIVRKVDLDHVGIALDCFHFHAMGSKLADLAAADGKKIFALHVSDADGWPVGMLQDEDRTWPGDGVVELHGILATLREIGFCEPTSVELFGLRHRRMHVEELVRKARERTLAVLEKHYEYLR